MTESRDVYDVLSELVPLTDVATVSAGASAELASDDARMVTIGHVWDLIHSHVEHVPPPPPPPPEPPLPDQLGPFNWNPITLAAASRSEDGRS